MKIITLNSQISKSCILGFAMLVTATMFSFSQTNELTLYFSAYDSVTLQNVPIDSVVIQNMSQQDTMTIYGPAPEITLHWTGITEPGTRGSEKFELEPGYPNPFYGSSTITIHVFDRQQLDVNLQGIYGEILFRMSREFNPGSHLIEVSAGHHKLCFVSVSDGQTSKTTKLISMSQNQASIKYTGQTAKIKSARYITSFDFNPGDTLHYSVYAANYFIFEGTDAPYESTGYTFELIPLPEYNLPTVTINEILILSDTAAICEGEVTHNGGAEVTARGVCWGLSPEPTIVNDTTNCGHGTGVYSGLMANLSPGTEYYVRTWATNSEGIAYSEETLTFETSPGKLYVPGDYQGWDPSEAPMIYDFNGDAVYAGYISFPEGGTLEFKFTSAPSWDYTVYGYGGEGMLDTDPGANNLSVPQSGGYRLEVDIENLTWSYYPENWGVIGEWLGWAEDIDMEWDIETQELSVTAENIPAAENQRFKFRANDAWETNLGSIYPPDGETLVQDGSDIPIPEGGTITFILRFTTPMPTYELIYR